jgi:RNA polymerase sigma-70 factor (ECF subfamily)
MAGFDASVRALPRLGGEPVTVPARRQDAALVRDARRGAAAAWDELFERHWPMALRAAYLIVHDQAAAEDVAQESFLAALGALDRFDRRRPFAPWLHRIVVNRAIDHTRARTRRAERPEQEAAEPAVAPPGAPGDALLAAVAALPPEQRAVVVLRYLLEWTPGEIARGLKLPRGTVNSRLRRALDALGDQLGEAPG